MHPKIEARRKTVDVARRVRDFEHDRDMVLLELRHIRHALRGISIDKSTIDNFLLAVDRIGEALINVDVSDDDDHNEKCQNLILSSRKFIESAKRTIAAAANI